MILPILLSRKFKKEQVKEQTYRTNIPEQTDQRSLFFLAKNKYLDDICMNYVPVHRFDSQHKWLDDKH